MKIVFIGCRSLNTIGGIETYMLNLCSCLVVRGIDVVLYVGSDCNKVEYLNGIKIIHKKVNKTKYFNKIMIGLKSTFYALKNDFNADIFHYNANVAGIFSLFPLLLGKKVVFQGHGFEWKRTKWSLCIRFLDRILDYFVILINKNILMCSREQIIYIQKKFKKKNVMHAPGGVKYPPVKVRNDSANFLYDDVPYILFLGRIVKEKRCDLLLNAFQNIQNEIACNLVIAGPIEDELLVSRYRENQRIQFVGPVFGYKKNLYMEKALIYVIPSDIEGLSLSLLEAMSYGCLCLASDIPPNREALADAGLYFTPGDTTDLCNKLCEAIINNENYFHLRLKAENRVREFFDWDKLADRMINYYRAIQG
jgi:glycosyltransferase involved in cell wall biosynthesis